MKLKDYVRILFKEYKKSVPDVSVEEILNLYLFRPIAFIIVKLIHRLPITPNQISFFTIIIGIISGIFYAKGDYNSFILGAIFYGLTFILDCCDGMLARLKNCGTSMGRIIDGISDYVTGIVIYTGFAIGLSKSSIEFPISSWLLMSFCGACTIFHSIIFDYYKNEFMAHALDKTDSTREDIESFSNGLKKMKGKYLKKLLIIIYLLYSKSQIVNASKRNRYSNESYYNANKLLIQLWSLISPTTHIVVFMVSSILYRPNIFFYYDICVANILLLIIWIIQVKTNKKIAIE